MFLEHNPALRYDKHLFFCTNSRPDGKRSCGTSGAVQKMLCAKALIANITPKNPLCIRVSSSGCLGRCMDGPVLVIYPDNLWFSYRSDADIENIVKTCVLSTATDTPIE